MKITRRDLFKWHENLKECSEMESSRIQYAIWKNIDKIENENRIYLKMLGDTSEINKYEDERKQLCLIMCSKTQDGIPIIQNGTYIFTDYELFNNKINELKNKYKEAIEKIPAKDKALLDEEIEFEIEMIDESSLPDNLNGKFMSALYRMIRI